MKNPFKSFSQWNKNRWETRGINEWERQRANGKWLFAFKFAFVFSLAMTIGLSLFDYLLNGRIKIEDFWFKVPVNLILGVIAGIVTWNINEKKYRKFRREESGTPHFEQLD